MRRNLTKYEALELYFKPKITAHSVRKGTAPYNPNSKVHACAM